MEANQYPGELHDCSKFQICVRLQRTWTLHSTALLFPAQPPRTAYKSMQFPQYVIILALRARCVGMKLSYYPVS